MHEQAIAKEIIAQANAQGDVVGIEVHVGELAHLPYDEMEDVLKTMTNWKLTMKETPGEVACDCGFTGNPTVLEKGHDSTVFECPQCQMKMPKVTAGDQIVLVSVEVKA